MLVQCIYHVFKSVIGGILHLNLNNLPKLVLECFRTSLFHLSFGKGLLAPCGLQIPIVEIISNRIC